MLDLVLLKVQFQRYGNISCVNRTHYKNVKYGDKFDPFKECNVGRLSRDEKNVKEAAPKTQSGMSPIYPFGNVRIHT